MHRQPRQLTGDYVARDGHWREILFRNELMTGLLGPGKSNPISRITVASLADLGYQVKMDAADGFRK